MTVFELWLSLRIVGACCINKFISDVISGKTITPQVQSDTHAVTRSFPKSKDMKRCSQPKLTLFSFDDYRNIARLVSTGRLCSIIKKTPAWAIKVQNNINSKKIKVDLSLHFFSVIVFSFCGVLLSFFIILKHGFSALGFFNFFLILKIIVSNLSCFGLNFSVLSHLSRAKNQPTQKVLSETLWPF